MHSALGDSDDVVDTYNDRGEWQFSESCLALIQAYYRRFPVRSRRR